jgi:hypothetical protein
LPFAAGEYKISVCFRLKRKVTAIQIAGVRISTLFPVTPVIWIVGEFDLLDPLYPLVSPLVLGNQLEGISPFGRKRDIVHLISDEDIVGHHVGEGERGGVRIMCSKDYGVRTGIDTSFPDEIADQHAFPEEFYRPAFNIVQRDDLRVVPVAGKNFGIGQDARCRGQAGNGKPVIGSFICCGPAIEFS